MKRLIVTLTVAFLFAAAVHASAADLKPIHTQKTKDVVVTLASESGSGRRGRTTSCLRSRPPRTISRSTPARRR